MADDQAPPPETPQTPVSEALPEPIPLAPSEPIAEPTPQAEASASSEPAQPVSEVVESAAEPQSEPSAPEPEPAPTNAGAASTASAPKTAQTNTPDHNRELLMIARAKRQTKKQQKLEKIMTLFEKKEKITNDEVEKLLHCSDATALRYLNELVKQGKIQRVGKTGAGVEYTRI